MGPQPSRLTDKNVLFIIDPQVDFLPSGKMPVPGSAEDADRIADMIMKHVDDIDEIYVTLDSHNRNHIAHAIFWEDSKGNPPRPYQIIAHDDVGVKWWPRERNHLAWCKEYTLKLMEGNRFIHCIWPEHCLIGTSGNNVVPIINDALQHWAGKRKRNIRYVHKGMNNLTEMYSCIQADVPIDEDPSTLKNMELMRKLLSCKRLMICGQSSSHSVHFTTLDILHDCPHGHEGRMVLLVDAMSPVTGCEEKGIEFLEYCEQKGVTISTTQEIFSIPCLPLPFDEMPLSSRRDTLSTASCKEGSTAGTDGKGGETRVRSTTHSSSSGDLLSSVTTVFGLMDAGPSDPEGTDTSSKA